MTHVLNSYTLRDIFWKYEYTYINSMLALKVDTISENIGVFRVLIKETINQELLEALKELVDINERHNSAIEKIIGKRPGWNDSYLDRAREAIRKAENY